MKIDPIGKYFPCRAPPHISLPHFYLCWSVKYLPFVPCIYTKLLTVKNNFSKIEDLRANSLLNSVLVSILLMQQMLNAQPVMGSATSKCSGATATAICMKM